MTAVDRFQPNEAAEYWPPNGGYPRPVTVLRDEQARFVLVRFEDTGNNGAVERFNLERVLP